LKKNVKKKENKRTHRNWGNKAKRIEKRSKKCKRLGELARVHSSL